ncbi:hypothetical protein ROV06_004958 [Serratia marcescens]|nr:hypothetical protein [Serratia marcescens]
MIMAFVGGQHSAQVVMAQQLAKDLKGCYRVKHIDTVAGSLEPEKKLARLRRLILNRKANRKARDLVIVVTGINEQCELDLLRRHQATICIPHAPLHSLFDENPITPADLFVCCRSGSLESEQKRRQYITPEEAFSACYSRARGFRDAV